MPTEDGSPATVDLYFATGYGRWLRADRNRFGADRGFAGAYGHFVSEDRYSATTSLNPAIADGHLASADEDLLIADACFVAADA